MRTCHLLALASAMALLCPAVTRAQGLTFAFTAPTQSGASGAVLHYAGTVTNKTGGVVYLTFDSLSLSPATVATGDDTVFFTAVTVPYISGSAIAIADAATFTLPVFDVTLTPGAEAGASASGLFSMTADTSADPSAPPRTTPRATSRSPPSSPPPPSRRRGQACSSGRSLSGDGSCAAAPGRPVGRRERTLQRACQGANSAPQR